jgi:tetratricopeptide (TPR) repeat protein
MFVIAGRDPLDQNWTAFEPVIHRIDLNPLSESDAESYLRNHQITNAETIRVIMQLSGCIPLLLATLASQSPDDPAEVGDPSGDAVERFLKWVENPKQREAALYGAFPLILNQNILEIMTKTDDISALFSWLKRMPFVKQVKDGWVYHEVVRSQMLRYARKENPHKWRELHQSLAAHFLKEKTTKESSAEGQDHELTIASDDGFSLYHQLCASPESTLANALNLFLDALKIKRLHAKKIAEMINQAGTDAGSVKIGNWGTRFLNGLNAYEKDEYQVVVDLFSDLLEFKGLDENKRAVGFGWRGEVYRLMENHEAALRDFDHAIEVDEKYQWAIAHRGATYHMIKNYAAALKDFNSASALNEKYQWAIARRGRTYRMMKNYEAALKNFNRAIELDEKYQFAIGSRARIYHAMKNYEVALQDFNRAIELDEKVAWVIAGRGETYRLMKNYEAAFKDFNRAIGLDEKYEWAIASRGETHRMMKNYEAAFEDFNRAIELNEKDQFAIGCRAQTYCAIKNYEAALQDFDRAVALDDKVAWVIAGRGETHRLMRNYDAALKDFNRAIELAEKYTWALARRGNTYRLMGNYEAALKDFNRAIELDDKYQWATAMRGETYRLMKIMMPHSKISIALLN